MHNNIITISAVKLSTVTISAKRNPWPVSVISISTDSSFVPPQLELRITVNSDRTVGSLVVYNTAKTSIIQCHDNVIVLGLAMRLQYYYIIIVLCVISVYNRSTQIYVCYYTRYHWDINTILKLIHISRAQC